MAFVNRKRPRPPAECLGLALRCGDVLEVLRDTPTGAFDFVIGSPPYPGKMSRYGGRAAIKATGGLWAEWFAEVMAEAGRVSRGFAVFVVNGSVRQGRYDLEVERATLALDARIKAAECSTPPAERLQIERPVIWHKNAPPNRRDWFGNDWEFCLAVRKPGAEFNGAAIGTPPKFKAGGRFRQRTASGARRLGGEYPQGQVTRPRDVLRVTVGGGHLGSTLAHENEAPYPEKLVEPFLAACCRPGGRVLDPFVGSGTTVAVALRMSCRAAGIDNRHSQIDLTLRRAEEVRAKLGLPPIKIDRWPSA